MGSKYNAKKVTVDDLKFDSKKEAKRYQKLKEMEQYGIIKNLQMQVPYQLIPPQYDEITEMTKSGKLKTKKVLVERKVVYVADFVYEQDGKIVVEDVKGYRRGGAYANFVIKRKLMLQVWGVKVREV